MEMSDPISVKLNGLLSQQYVEHTFTDTSDLVVITTCDQKYLLRNVKDSKIIMQGGCKRLTLQGCNNIAIIADRIPIMGIHATWTDNVSLDVTGTPPDSGIGYIAVDHIVNGLIGTDQECTVEVNCCTGILLNDVNISDQYRDSTWTC